MPLLHSASIHVEIAVKPIVVAFPHHDAVHPLRVLSRLDPAAPPLGAKFRHRISAIAADFHVRGPHIPSGTSVVSTVSWHPRVAPVPSAAADVRLALVASERLSSALPRLAADICRDGLSRSVPPPTPLPLACRSLADAQARVDPHELATAVPVAQPKRLVSRPHGEARLGTSRCVHGMAECSVRPTPPLVLAAHEVVFGRGAAVPSQTSRRPCIHPRSASRGTLASRCAPSSFPPAARERPSEMLNSPTVKRPSATRMNCPVKPFMPACRLEPMTPFAVTT